MQTEENLTTFKTLSRISMIDIFERLEAKKILQHQLRKRRREGPDDTAMRALLLEGGGNVTVMHYIIVITSVCMQCTNC